MTGNTKGFEKDYAAFEEIKAAYDNAKDEAGQERARADFKAWVEGIEAKGRSYADTFRIYKDSRDNGNERLNISEPNEYRDIPELITDLRGSGIRDFTFSSRWSSAIEASWEFLQNGCELEGMVEIYTSNTKFMSEERSTTPAYLFRIKE